MEPEYVWYLDADAHCERLCVHSVCPAARRGSEQSPGLDFANMNVRYRSACNEKRQGQSVNAFDSVL